jgi:superfamily I DNA/RNA helicase
MTSTSTQKSTLKAAAMHSSLPPLTPEGTDILDLVCVSDDNICIEAYAGCGKTTMLKYIARDAPQKSKLYLAFNKDVADEARDEFPPSTEVRTLNSMGYQCYRDSIGRKLTLIKTKTKDILVSQIKELSKDDQSEAWDSFYDICQTVGMAKHLGYVPEGKFQPVKPLINRQGLENRVETQLSELCWDLVDLVLIDSIKAATAGTVDFDDQVYMPALFGGSFPRYSLVLVDEDQDLSPANHALLRKLAKDRVIAVGDRWQSIYYFRGAETGSVDKLKLRYNMTEMPLPTSFRCPEAVVNAAKWRVPGLKWVKPGGRYEKLSDFPTIPEHAAVICRNNAPLLKLAYQLLSEGRSVKVVGGEIGPKIIALMLKVGDEGDTRDTLLGKIADWRKAKLERTNSPDTINDQADCMAIFANWGQTLEQAVAYANRIFKEQGAITLTTGHKAKGREWNVVYHLDPHLCRDNDQDLNLRYVITTRAASELYEVKSNGNE